MTDLHQTLAQFTTCVLSDAADSLSLQVQCFGLVPTRPDVRIAGPAFTLRYLPVGTSGGTVGDFLHLVQPGAVIVIDNAGRTDCTIWGGILSEVAHRQGVAGAVIWGMHRDQETAVATGFPLFTCGAFMRTGKGRVALEQINGPVGVAGVRIEPGDLVVADANGVVAIPQARAADVAARAAFIAGREAALLDEVARTDNLEQARAAVGYHDLQSRR